MRRPRLDLLVDNADIVTMDPARPRARRLGISNGRIAGLDEELAGWDADERLDLDGGCVLPGFVDAHTHLELTGQGLAALDISGCASPLAALDVIAAAVSTEAADDDWLEVSGYDHRVLGRHLTADELHVAARGRKVWVRQISGHASVVSTAVLADLAPEHRPGPEAAGLFKERDQSLVLAQRLPYPADQVTSLVVTAAEQARAQGITTCVDAGNGGEVGALTPVDGAAYLAALESGRLPVRVQLMPSIDVLRELANNQADGFRRGLDLGLRSGFGSDWLGIAAQKVVLDGGMQVETARLSSPYVGTASVGVWRQDPQAMVDATVDGHRAGWQMALHAIGDAALDLAIEAFEKAQAAWPRPDARHRVEHGGVIREDQLARLASLGVAVVSQPSFLYDYGDHYAEQLGAQRTAWLYRGRSLLEHGIKLVGSTDRPLPGDPLRAVQTLVGRASSSGQVLAPAERITVHQALEAFTTTAAWVLRREDRLGRVAPRYLADLTLLAGNPLDVDPTTIADIPVVGTVVDGRTWLA